MSESSTKISTACYVPLLLPTTLPHDSSLYNTSSSVLVGPIPPLLRLMFGPARSCIQPATTSAVKQRVPSLLAATYAVGVEVASTRSDTDGLFVDRTQYASASAGAR